MYILYHIENVMLLLQLLQNCYILFDYINIGFQICQPLSLFTLFPPPEVFFPYYYILPSSLAFIFKVGYIDLDVFCRNRSILFLARKEVLFLFMKKTAYETPTVEILMFDTVQMLTDSTNPPIPEIGEGDLDIDAFE